MLLAPNEIYRDLIIDRLARVDIETAVIDNAAEIRGRLRVIEEHGGELDLLDAPVFEGNAHRGAMAEIRLPTAVGLGKAAE